MTKETLTGDIFQEAVQRYTDTSWQIHRQSKKKPTTITIDIPPKDDDENKTLKINGVTPNGNVNNPETEIETVEVTYEPVQSQVEVVLVRESVTNN